MKLKQALKYLPAVLFVGFISVMFLLWLILPKQHYSAQEKRVLADFPMLNAETLFNGNFQKELDTYLSDHTPARSFFIGLNADYQLITGRNGQSGIYLGKDEYLFPKPVKESENLLRNAQFIKEFADSSDIPVYMTVIPSSGYVNHNKLPLIHEEYTDDQLIRSFSKALGDKVQYVDSAEPFFEVGDKGQLYYRTDHHWTSKGAYKCYSLLGNALGYTPLKEESFTKETVTDFYGTSYAKAALWAIAPDVIELWHNKKQPEDSVTVEIRDGADVKTSHSYFFPDQLRNDDKYPVFLDGNHSLVTVTNENAEDRTLVVVKDSYAHTIVPFLSQHYRNIIMVDLRYYKKDVSALAKEHQAEGVLLLYSLDNLSEDTNLSYLF